MSKHLQNVLDAMYRREKSFAVNLYVTYKRGAHVWMQWEFYSQPIGIQN